MDPTRIFIAIDISEEVRSAVAEYIRRIRSDFPRVHVGWERPEKLHFTIRFLGDTSEDQLENLLQVTESVADRSSPFDVRITETGVFPHPKDPKILRLGVKEGNEEMKMIHDDLDAHLESIGIDPEKRRFSPHLTIGRLREPAKAKELVRTHKQRQLEPIRFTADGITIYESKLEKAGSVYSAIRLFQFSKTI